MLTLLSPHRSFPGPGDPWTLPQAEEFLRRHDPAVTQVFLEIQQEMAGLHRGCPIYLARYDARSLVRAYPRRTLLARQLVALVQVRTALGRIISAAIAVEWATGDVVVKGWPEPDFVVCGPAEEYPDRWLRS